MTRKVLGALVIVVAAASGCSRSEGEDTRTWREGAGDPESARKEEAVPVEVVALERGAIEAVLRFSANLEAEREVQVFAEATRRVQELLVEEGSSVSKGQLLVQLQDDEQRSAVAKAGSLLEQAEREYERQKNLYAQNLVSEQLFNDAHYQVEQLQLAVDDARRALSYTEVRAPINGVISERLVNLGDFVSVNQPLFRVVDFDSIVARIYVPEKELSRLRPGQPARLKTEAAGSSQLSGSIDRISPVVDPGSGTIRVTVAIPRQTGLRPGMFVQVELVTAVHEDAVLVPKRSLVYNDDQIFVFRLGEERRVERLRLEPALENPDFVEPSSGLEAGEEIVVAGQSSLKDGALVRLPGDPEPSEDGEDAGSDEAPAAEAAE